MTHPSIDPADESNMQPENLIQDYKIAFSSRQASLIGRKEVLGGKAKFGIFGDGKELAQIAMARAFRRGDWRSGYYRDQTFMFALGEYTFRQFFAQLYAHADIRFDPASGGRQMNSHFASRFLDENENWLNQTSLYNSSADLSPTGGQMARLLGLAYASKLYRESQGLQQAQSTQFSRNGNEVAFGTIGNASTSEGVFWECLNAAGVLQVPLLISVWDDDYGISVPSKYQTTKESISELLSGFAHSHEKRAFNLYQVEGYDYEGLIRTYQQAAANCRSSHSPAMIHVRYMTQPQGHSTSGSHERYKDQQRLRLEEERDCLLALRRLIIQHNYLSEEETERIEEELIREVRKAQEQAWEDFQAPLIREKKQILPLLSTLQTEMNSDILNQSVDELERSDPLLRRHLHSAVRKLCAEPMLPKNTSTHKIREWCHRFASENRRTFSAALYSESDKSPLKVEEVAPTYSEQEEWIDGRQVIQRYFEKKLTSDQRIFILGEDVGVLGGVNLEFEGLQDTFGPLRVTDTGIREATILGQGIGAAMRGLKPIADIQYLDYLIYAIQGLSDDLATLRYRSANGQACPLIVRTKGHRLEGIWHSGSPMGMILHALRGVHICVPRDAVQAAGFYQTLLQGDDPGLVIEVLNGYRIKERCPDNLGHYSIPLGVPEILNEGTDLTIVTYGANIRIAQSVIPLLARSGIYAELIDVRTLLPFDINGIISESLRKTNCILFMDEDVPGGASAFMMQQVLEKQNAYDFLDAAPATLTAQEHRPAYGSDGDYYSKPSADDLVEQVFKMMHERNPSKYPLLPF
ncbi:MAG: transketolase [Deltaproteobacteria bacterium]|nr:transketolase [Deltaproteobacteria bacterium]